VGPSVDSLPEREPAAVTDWRRERSAVIRIPVNSYRVQLSRVFDLDAAAAVLPYLDRLGITDCYTSPYFMAGRDSPSGYDVCDHLHIQPELGGEEAYERFVHALHAHRLGHVVDVVANHMGIDATRNGWWRDVLTRGHRSPFAVFFDVDWQPVKPELHDRILLPILGKPYGDALADGDLRLEHRGQTWVISYGRHDLPVNPDTIAEDVDPSSFTAIDLHDLLERQVYRLAYWRTASDEINYRRFFDVDDLVGVRMEEESVFAGAHARLSALIRDGVVTSLRVDHPDGLANPRAYFERVQAIAQEGKGAGIHVVAEKILMNGERLADDWFVHGTTGYEFLNQLNGLFVSPDGRDALRRTYRALVGGRPSWFEETYASRRLIMKTTLGSEIQMLANMLNRISERNPRSRDFTLNSLRRALVDLLANLTVYRTYIDPDRSSPQDVRRLESAATSARHRSRTLEPSLFRFIVAVMAGGESAASLDYPPVDDRDAAERRRFVQRLQQFSGSVFAKGVEDTALYRYQPLLSLNEVGNDPERSARPAADFHRQNEWRATDAPFGFLTTETHDTKLGEDVRTRIDALSEFTGEWTSLVRRWRRRVASLRVRSDWGWMPDPNDEYRFFQILAGTWPIEPAASIDAGGVPRWTLASPSAEYEARIADYMLKSVKEAKRHTTWINPDAGYEDAVRRVVHGVLAGPACRAVRADAEDLLMRIARVGAMNSLSQLVLKLTSPGVADIYQGGELWDFNLVDPDNRRAVDFGLRARLLEDLEPLLRPASIADAGVSVAARALLDDWPSGRIKLYITAALLRARREMPELFLEGEYVPLAVSGDSVGRLVAFARTRGSRGLLVAAPHLVAPLMDHDAWPTGDAAWGEDSVASGRLEVQFPALNIFTGESLPRSSAADHRGTLRIADLVGQLPIGVWMWGR